VKARTGAWVCRAITQSRSLWCVSSCGYGTALVHAFTHHTRWFGCVGVPFREGTNRGVGVSCNHAKWIALVRVMVMPWCVPSRTIHDGLVCVPFREGTNRGGSVSCYPLCGSQCCVTWCGHGACYSAALVRAFTHQSNGLIGM